MPSFGPIQVSISVNPTGNLIQDRTSIREQLITVFLKEHPGTGTGPLRTDYRYDAENIGGNNFLYLERPARLNKGFDFIVRLDGQKFAHLMKNGRIRNDNIPSHDNVLDDLRAKKNYDSVLYASLRHQIDLVYQCHEPSAFIIPNSFTQFPGMAAISLLMTIKWLFIEQDITYWNFSGRDMLMDGIRGI